MLLRVGERLFCFAPEDCASVLRSSLPPAPSHLSEHFSSGISADSPLTALGEAVPLLPRSSCVQGFEVNTCILCSTWKLNDNQN